MTVQWGQAVRAGDLEMLASLLAGGADIDAKDRHNQTGLMIAAADGRDDVVAWLVERGAALDHTAKFRLSALMLAVVRGQLRIVRQLVDAGADRTLRGAGAPGFAGKTALDLAVDRGDTAMIDILRAAPLCR